MHIQHFKVIRSPWPNEEGEYLWTITDGVRRKGEFTSREDAEANMTRIIASWRADS